MFPQPYVPTAQCSHHSPMFPQKNLEMWEHRAVGTSGLIFQNKSGNIGLWEHSFSKLSVKKKSLEMWKHRAVGTFLNVGLEGTFTLESHHYNHLMNCTFPPACHRHIDKEGYHIHIYLSTFAVLLSFCLFAGQWNCL